MAHKGYTWEHCIAAVMLSSAASRLQFLFVCVCVCAFATDRPSYDLPSEAPWQTPSGPERASLISSGQCMCARMSVCMCVCVSVWRKLERCHSC